MASKKEEEMREFLNQPTNEIVKMDLARFAGYLARFKEDIEDRELLSRFISLVYNVLKGNTAASDLCKQYGIKLKRSKSLTFNTKVHSYNLRHILSREGKRQQAREKAVPGLFNKDQKKNFKPTPAMEVLKENITTVVHVNDPSQLSFTEDPFTKVLNGITFTLQDVIANPNILNKYAH